MQGAAMVPAGDFPCGDPASSTTLRRHDRVWLALDWRDAAPVVGPDARVDDWVAAGRALVVRRRDRPAADGLIALGIALPVAACRARIGLVVARCAVARTAPPLALVEVVAHAVPRRAALCDLVARGADCGTTFAVYGSYAWQAISGEPCVTRESDIDLLWDARDATHVEAVIATLLRWERDHGLRADGDARFAAGDIAWRELAAGHARVLVKRADDVVLAPSPLAGAYVGFA